MRTLALGNSSCGFWADSWQAANGRSAGLSRPSASDPLRKPASLLARGQLFQFRSCPFGTDPLISQVAVDPVRFLAAADRVAGVEHRFKAVDPSAAPARLAGSRALAEAGELVVQLRLDQRYLIALDFALEGPVRPIARRMPCSIARWRVQVFGSTRLRSPCMATP
jgi:hypothetical protein